MNIVTHSMSLGPVLLTNNLCHIFDSLAFAIIWSIWIFGERMWWIILVETNPNLHCQPDSTWFRNWVFRENIGWTAAHSLVYSCGMKQVQIRLKFIWFCFFRENMWWTYSLIHCRIKHVQTCTANLIQKFFWLLLTYLESVCSCICTSSSPGNSLWTVRLIIIKLLYTLGSA